MIAKAELQEGRIAAGAPRPRSTGAGAGGDGEDQVKKAERLKMLQNRRERLENTVERLSLQAAHKVRLMRGFVWYVANSWYRRGN